MIQQQAQEVQNIKTAADTAVSLKNAQGADAIISPAAVEATEAQFERVIDEQNKAD